MSFPLAFSRMVFSSLFFISLLLKYKIAVAATRQGYQSFFSNLDMFAEIAWPGWRSKKDKDAGNKAGSTADTSQGMSYPYW